MSPEEVEMEFSRAQEFAQENDKDNGGLIQPLPAQDVANDRASLQHWDPQYATDDYHQTRFPFDPMFTDNSFNADEGLASDGYYEYQSPPIPQQAMTSAANAGLGQPVYHEYEYPPIPGTSMTSANDEEPSQTTSYSEHPMTSADDALSPATGGTPYMTPEVSLSLDSTRKYLRELDTLEDGVKAAYVPVENHLSRIQKEQTVLWKKHPDLRRRGLRGGRARKQNATGNAFVSITKLTAVEYERRKAVETQDYKARTRSTGLQHLADVFDSCYKLIHKQQRLARLVLEHGNSLTSESAALLELQEAHAQYETAIAGIDREKMAEIREMLDTFNAEFRCE